MTPSPNTESKTPALCCDLCQWPMSISEVAIKDGQILGLLVCSECVEDNLSATTNEPRTEVGLVGGCA